MFFVSIPAVFYGFIVLFQGVMQAYPQLLICNFRATYPATYTRMLLSCGLKITNFTYYRNMLYHRDLARNEEFSEIAVINIFLHV